MNTHASESEWLDESNACTAERFIELSGLSSTDLAELVAIGVIASVDCLIEVQCYQQSYVVTAMRAGPLRDDFELDLHGMALAVTLMRRIEMLQQELAAARARLLA